MVGVIMLNKVKESNNLPTKGARNLFFLTTIFAFFLFSFGCTSSDTFIIQNKEYNLDLNIEGSVGQVPFMKDSNSLEVAGLSYDKDTNVLSGVSNLVPYTGATTDINLGAKKLIFSTATTREVGYLVLDGDEDSVSTGYWGNFENVDFSVSAWVKIESNPSTNATIIAHDGYNIDQRSWRFQINANRYLRADFFPIGSQPVSTSLTANTPISTGEWHHVAMVRVYGGLSKLYLDGQEVASGNLGNNDGTLDVETRIGAVGSGGSRFALFFDGGISQLAVLDRELTQDEILKIYSNGRVGYVGDSTDYNGLYLFSGTPNDFNDYSGNSHNGTGYGDAYTEIENVDYTSLAHIYNDGNNLVVDTTYSEGTYFTGAISAEKVIDRTNDAIMETRIADLEIMIEELSTELCEKDSNYTWC